MTPIIENRVLKRYSGNDTQFTVPEGVTKIGEGAFNGCDSLTQITIPDGVTEIGSAAFCKCTSIIRINIPDTVTVIGQCSFRECICLTQINIPVTITKISNAAFQWCISLTQITIPVGVTKIGDSAFSCCSSLTQITIPEGVTKIGEWTFGCCTSLTQITIPEGVTEIVECSLYGCIHLTQINIPDSVTKIRWSAFERCTGLTQTNIPLGLTEMVEDVFKDCANLQRIVVSNNNDVVRVKSYLPDELKDKVTSYYTQYQLNLMTIIQSQLVLNSQYLNLFRYSKEPYCRFPDFLTRNTYRFLSIQDIMILSSICTGLKPIKDIAQSIKAVRYQGIIPRVKPATAVKRSFLQQYTPNINDKELTDYHHLLNRYKWNLRRSISASLSESKINNNSHEEKNDRGMLC